jgi:hypothetical protein
MIDTKNAEHEKATERLGKEIRKSQARSTSGSFGALVGVKTVQRTRIHLEKIVQVRKYLEGVVKDTKEIMIKGKENPKDMVMPMDIEKVKKNIKKIEKEVEKEVEKSGSTTTSSSRSSTEDSERFFKELHDLDRSAVVN